MEQHEVAFNKYLEFIGNGATKSMAVKMVIASTGFPANSVKTWRTRHKWNDRIGGNETSSAVIAVKEMPIKRAAEKVVKLQQVETRITESIPKNTLLYDDIKNKLSEATVNYLDASVAASTIGLRALQQLQDSDLKLDSTKQQLEFWITFLNKGATLQKTVLPKGDKEVFEKILVEIKTKNSMSLETIGVQHDEE